MSTAMEWVQNRGVLRVINGENCDVRVILRYIDPGTAIGLDQTATEITLFSLGDGLDPDRDMLLFYRVMVRVAELSGSLEWAQYYRTRVMELEHHIQSIVDDVDRQKTADDHHVWVDDYR